MNYRLSSGGGWSPKCLLLLCLLLPWQWLPAQSAGPPAPGPSLAAKTLSRAQQDALVSGASAKLWTFFDYQAALVQDSLAPAFRQALAEGMTRLFVSDTVAIGPYPSLGAFLEALAAGDSPLPLPQAGVESRWMSSGMGMLVWATSAGHGQAVFYLLRQEKRFGQGKQAVWEVKLGRIELHP